MSMASNLGLSSKSSKSTVTNVAEQAPMSENIEVATYREMMVSVKRLRKTGIILTRPDHMELKIVSFLFSFLGDFLNISMSHNGAACSYIYFFHFWNNIDLNKFYWCSCDDSYHTTTLRRFD